MRDLLC